MGKPRGIRHFALLFLLGLPLTLFAVIAGLPRLTGGKGLIPNNEYWFADKRKQQTESFLLQHSSWLGTMTVACYIRDAYFGNACK
jgi:hypothetical protein